MRAYTREDWIDLWDIIRKCDTHDAPLKPPTPANPPRPYTPPADPLLVPRQPVRPTFLTPRQCAEVDMDWEEYTDG